MGVNSKKKIYGLVFTTTFFEIHMIEQKLKEKIQKPLILALRLSYKNLVIAPFPPISGHCTS